MGPHQLGARLTFEGRSLGPFTYVESYAVNVSSKQRFFVPAGKDIELTVVIDERPDRTAPLLKRPEVRMEGDLEPAPPEPR
jgi:hypothetical protein